MPFHDIPVRRLEQEQIEGVAQQWLSLAAKTCGANLDLLGLYAAAKVQLIARPDTSMGENLALADPQKLQVFIRASVLQAAEKGDTDAKMVLAHELGHIALHRGAEQKARKAEGNANLSFIPEEESSEVQAWKFGRALTMPLLLARNSESAEQLARICGVPIEQARLRLQEVQTKVGKRETPACLQLLVKPNHSRAMAAEAKKAKQAREMLRVWNNAPRVRGDTTNSRLCHRGKWRVIFSEYNRMTECGWIIQNGQIVAWKDLENK